MSEVFKVDRLVRHGHTDPAGIVYYPRYYEMINNCVEDMFRDAFNRPFGHMHLKDKIGVPTVKMNTEFFAPSLCDDILTFCISVIKLSTSSITLDVTAYCGDEKRLAATQTLVYIDMTTMKSAPIDDELRANLTKFLKD